MIRERIKAGMAEAHTEGKPHGSPQTAATKGPEIKRLYKEALVQIL